MNPNPEVAPDFTERQIQWLKKIFPEVVARPSVPIDEVRFNSGSRYVIHVIESAMAQKNKRG